MTTASTANNAPARTRTLLTCAAMAAPIWAVVSFAQAFTREGFDITRHPLSALATGSLGWLQITNFLVVGALVVAGGAGLRRALHGTPGGTWAPRLIVVNGLALIAAGVFVMDPADGFPVGTPAGMPETMSWHSVLHMVAGSMAFLALSAACFVLGRHFSRRDDRVTAVASRVAGVVVIVGNAWPVAGGPGGSLALAIGVTGALAWVSWIAVQLRRRA